MNKITTNELQGKDVSPKGVADRLVRAVKCMWSWKRVTEDNVSVGNSQHEGGKSLGIQEKVITRKMSSPEKNRLTKNRRSPRKQLSNFDKKKSLRSFQDYHPLSSISMNDLCSKEGIKKPVHHYLNAATDRNRGWLLGITNWEELEEIVPEEDEAPLLPYVSLEVIKEENQDTMQLKRERKPNPRYFDVNQFKNYDARKGSHNRKNSLTSSSPSSVSSSSTSMFSMMRKTKISDIVVWGDKEFSSHDSHNFKRKELSEDNSQRRVTTIADQVTACLKKSRPNEDSVKNNYSSLSRHFKPSNRTTRSQGPQTRSGKKMKMIN